MEKWEEKIVEDKKVSKEKNQKPLISFLTSQTQQSNIKIQTKIPIRSQKLQKYTHLKDLKSHLPVRRRM
jgi:hypothetical protein